MEPLGLYLHVPFCRQKCPYCDFYSTPGGEEEREAYQKALLRSMREWSVKLNRQADTLYIGGGTPILLGPERLYQIVVSAREWFGLSQAEITCEANPSTNLSDTFRALKQAGVNRISMGMQSANQRELDLLGRGHTAQDVAKAVQDAQKAGIENISLDLMLCLPGQTLQELKDSIAFCDSLGVQHLSGYLLKVEPHTAFGKMGDQLILPTEEQQCALYFCLCEQAEKRGFLQYEISNFAKEGKNCRHNLKYWHAQEYLGLGPAAHSFVGGHRFYYPRDTKAFCKGIEPIEEGTGGDFEEYAMLCLRTDQGLREEKVQSRFGVAIPLNIKKRAQALVKLGLVRMSPESIVLTREGFLVSNSVIAELLYGGN